MEDDGLQKRFITEPIKYGRKLHSLFPMDGFGTLLERKEGAVLATGSRGESGGLEAQRYYCCLEKEPQKANKVKNIRF